MRKMKALIMKMEPVTLICKGRLNLKCMKLIVNYFFLGDFYF